jgi:sugar O-acyltransferase (sialic acid O-acetyltransferase NeuD family)
MTLRPIVIYGGGGFAREVLTLIEDINAARPTWEVAGFLDDDEARRGQRLCGLPILGGRAWLEEASPRPAVVLGVGSPVVKRAMHRGLTALGVDFPALVHPNVVMSRRVRVGAGAVITAGNVLTTEIEVRPFTTLNLACTVGHDSVLGDYVTVSPGVNLSGNVRVGQGTDVGTGSKVIQGISIGEWSVVGAGAVVARDLPANCTAVGVPAKVIKVRDPDWHEG